jgi:hypothetical protein
VTFNILEDDEKRFGKEISEGEGEGEGVSLK